MRRRRMVFLHGGTARAGPGSGVPRRALTTRVMAATPGQPGVRAPGAWWCGSARVRRSVAVGRHGAVRQGRRRHRGAGGRAGVARAASSVTVVPSRRRVRRELRHNPGAMRKPALWRGAPTEVVDLEGRRTRTVTLRAAGTPLTDAMAWEVCCVVLPPRPPCLPVILPTGSRHFFDSLRLPAPPLLGSSSTPRPAPWPHTRAWPTPHTRGTGIASSL